MKITLKDVLEKKIFKQYTVVTKKADIEKEVESVSILETPDFEHYIIEKSLILTTFYPIKNEIELAKELLNTLAVRNTSGLIIKVHRYIDEIPQELISLADTMNIPIITLDYDANLSVLFNNILSEIQIRDYSNLSMDENYSEVLQKIYDNPTTKTLMETVENIDNLDMLIENLESHTTYHTSKDVLNYYVQFKNTKNLIQRIDDMLYYSEDVIYDEKPIYRMVFLARSDRRHIIHNYIEIFKLIIVVVYQKKLEIAFKQNQFLIDFISSYSNKNKSEIMRIAKTYKWNIVFPIILVNFAINDDEEKITQEQIQYIRALIVNKFHVTQSEIRYAIQNKQVIFIINIQNPERTHTNIRIIHSNIEKQFNSKTLFSIFYSDQINDFSIIPEKYELLKQGASGIINMNIPYFIFKESDIALLKLFKNVQFEDMRSYANKILGKIIEHEKKVNTPLIETLKVYIDTKFNVKETASKLFIHYNTVRYRLEQLVNLGIDVAIDQPYLDLYIALYIYTNFKI